MSALLHSRHVTSLPLECDISDLFCLPLGHMSFSIRGAFLVFVQDFPSVNVAQSFVNPIRTHSSTPCSEKPTNVIPVRTE